MPRKLAEAPQIPALAAHIWPWFLDLHAERMQQRGETLSRISAAAVRDWQWFAGVELEPWERKAIRRLDAAFINSRVNPSSD